MRSARRSAALGGDADLLASTSLMSKAALAEQGLRPRRGLEEFWLATDAYIFGYPLVTMEMTRSGS